MGAPRHAGALTAAAFLLVPGLLAQQTLQGSRRPGAAREVLEGAPLGTTPAPWSELDHPAGPGPLWLDAAAPLPTNAWWLNAALGSGDWPINPMPYSVRASEDGLSICRPGLNTQETFVMQTHLDNLRVRAVEGLTSRKVTAYHPHNVEPKWT